MSETECLTAWNDFAEKHGLAKVMVMNASRKAKLKRRLKDVMLYAEDLGFDNPVEGWNIALDKVGESDFLLGKKTDWKASFDFMLQEKSFHKVMEGAYVTKQKTGRVNANSSQSGFAGLMDFAKEHYARMDSEPRDSGVQSDGTDQGQGRLFA